MDRLTSPSTINAIKKRYNFYFNKRYGQNFLTDVNIIEKILEGSNITKEDYILEIGPGIGTLTQFLCERSAHVLAIEIDKNLMPILGETLADFSNKTIINADVLRIDISEELSKISGKQFKVIANLPYYITSEIVMTLLENKLPIESITVMVQKEVAHRMVATPGTKDYGSLSVAVQYYSRPEIITIVPKTVFIPQPKVESCVIKLNVLDNPPVKSDKDEFFKVVKASFSMRRKTLLNCLSSGLELDKEQVTEILQKSHVDPVRRGETLSLEEFATVANNYISFKSKI
ncbi:16S rRNA (adenine(1518)-N(6)/adenine(1519)-N(6))-dimethyltransferase RsmA [Alkalibaculum sp. M08DMB]|uniref:Ribosomal RNA small subunit methyltransferase A n=1 Tax=Alkalibaculum sporogenes TaxID=2655001 RepID=A0A6A7K7I5_9FIRM|nr:16S rRNA (adenine(1518)-N(6)/adenine(1519)-N(6))-dimethyltransferase RsmA [Alkalibaculum sporogenes]MPW25364.1 16S rRNA (adenine(1518)-N(6)/adenine(1519)-N(6))-dimethyltransferase RsmA [Alkalibaculum sporogenes]